MNRVLSLTIMSALLFVAGLMIALENTDTISAQYLVYPSPTYYNCIYPYSVYPYSVYPYSGYNYCSSPYTIYAYPYTIYPYP